MPESPDLREHLAAERTLLAYIRTGLAMMGFGFVVARFGLLLRSLNPSAKGDAGISLWFGTALALLGVAASSLSAWQYWRQVGEINRRTGIRYPPSRLAIALALVMALFGVGMAVYLIETPGGSTMIK